MEQGKASRAPRGKGGLGKKSHSLSSLPPFLSSPPSVSIRLLSPRGQERTFSPEVGGDLNQEGAWIWALKGQLICMLEVCE